MSDTTATTTPKYPALNKMIEKLDNRPAGHGGYVTGRDEVIDILSSLSKLVPASVILDRSYNDTDGVSATITVRVTVSRSELAELDAENA